MEPRLEYKELGLTQNESKAYETLLRLGKATASQISKEANIPYGRIYTVLESLEEKELLKVIPEKTRYYYPTDPEKLHSIIDNRIKNLMEIDNKIKDFKKIYEERTVEPVLVTKGKSSFHKLNSELKKSTNYEYNIKYVFSLSPEIIRRGREKEDMKIDHKTIGRIDSETKTNIEEWRKINKNIKPIQNDGIAMSIIDDEEVMIALIKSNTTMLIRDKAFAKVMRQLFIKYYMNTEYENEQ
ncbi:MAG: TrmB family transcriptional regulator [Candidatus Woesearchaeota archaeon]